LGAVCPTLLLNFKSPIFDLQFPEPQSPRPTFTVLFRSSHVTCHSSLPLNPADSPRHRLPGLTGGRRGSPPDSGGAGAFAPGGGHCIQEGAAASRRVWLQDPSLIRWEIPRLCRGGSKSSTFTGVTAHGPGSDPSPVPRPLVKARGAVHPLPWGEGGRGRRSGEGSFSDGCDQAPLRGQPP
jgi:hypothetical protein